VKTIEKFGEMKGSLVLKVIRDNEIEGVWSERERFDNLIVTSGRTNLAKLLAGKTGMHVSKVGVGSGKLTPGTTDTGLTNPSVVSVFEARIGVGLEKEGGVFNDPRVVQFHFRFEKAVAVGKEIWEYGLICDDNTLFSRITRPTSFIKTDIDVIVGFWQIQF
jgi:hypothetical protein